jgi:hypothetical protein
MSIKDHVAFSLNEHVLIMYWCMWDFWGCYRHNLAKPEGGP